MGRLELMKRVEHLQPKCITESHLIHKYLTSQATEKLPSCTNSKYADFVRFCLDDELPLGPSKDQKTYELFDKGIKGLEDLDAMRIYN